MKDDPSQFLLVEVYQTKEDQAKHRLADHFQKWRVAVQDLIAEPYTNLTYDNIFLDESVLKK
ncbi:hypothetical protein skT53_09610 [Effusibacillus dendaii]|uniref:ABM domain-containing protein n=2 Tax=Effusibacillus dendaii TaxID=2743772 RepID=A0A7I8DAW5_9BACL|nr:hypothetical protein skT53_09610 [Effusibacillus dendaii]